MTAQSQPTQDGNRQATHPNKNQKIVCKDCGTEMEGDTDHVMGKGRGQSEVVFECPDQECYEKFNARAEAYARVNSDGKIIHVDGNGRLKR